MIIDKRYFFSMRMAAHMAARDEATRKEALDIAVTDEATRNVVESTAKAIRSGMDRLSRG